MQRTRHTRPARSAAPAIARAGASVFAALAKRTKYMDPALAGRWGSLAGDKIASLSRPGRMTGAGAGAGSGVGAGRTLELYVPNGAAAAAVQMEIDGLIARLNAYLGPGTIARIAIIQTGQGPAAGSPAAAGAGPAPEDRQLSAALASFRAALSRRDERK